MNGNRYRKRWVGAYILLGILGSLTFLWFVFGSSGSSDPNEEIDRKASVLDLFREQSHPGMPSHFKRLAFGMTQEQVERLPLGAPPWKLPSHPQLSFIPKFTEGLLVGLEFEEHIEPSSEKLEAILGPPQHRVSRVPNDENKKNLFKAPRLVWISPNLDPNSTAPSICLNHDVLGLRWSYCKTVSSWFPARWDEDFSPPCAFSIQANKLWSQLQKCESFIKIKAHHFLLPPTPGRDLARVSTLYFGPKQELRSFKVALPYSDEYPSKQPILKILNKTFSAPREKEKRGNIVLEIIFEEEKESLLFRKHRFGKSPLWGVDIIHRIGTFPILISLWPNNKKTAGPTLPQGIPQNLFLDLKVLPAFDLEPSDGWNSWGVSWGTKENPLSSHGPLSFTMYLPFTETQTYFEELWGAPRWIEIEEHSFSSPKMIWISETLGFRVSVQNQDDFSKPSSRLVQASTLLDFGRYTPLKTLLGEPLKIGHLGFEPQDLMGLTHKKITRLFPPKSLSKLSRRGKSGGYSTLYLPATEASSKEMSKLNLSFSNGTLNEIAWSSDDILSEHIDAVFTRYLKALFPEISLSESFQDLYEMKTSTRKYVLQRNNDNITLRVTKR